MQTNLRILLVEDDEDFRSRVEASLGVYNCVEAASSIAQTRALIAKKQFDLIILDKTLTDGDGTTLLPELRREMPEVVIIILTADRNYGHVKQYMDMGADDYVAKSEVTISDLLLRIPVALRHADNDRIISRIIEVTKKALKHEIVGNAPSTAKLREEIQGFRGSQSNVLITGESGTGKELIAQRLHAIDKPGVRPFVAVNCSAIHENLIESELFGHKKGSFTDAIDDKKGLFELAHGGDLFLDEVAELPLTAQAKLLRVLQDGEVRRVGGDKPISVNVRVIAATNKSLEQLIQKGLFRADVFYRLNVLRFKTEPLRSRMEDIPDLAKCFVFQFGGVKATIADEAVALLQGYQWPGNIRELRNCIERAYHFARQRKIPRIEARDIVMDGETTAEPFQTGLVRLSIPTELSALTPQSYEKFMADAERHYLRQAIEICQGDSLKTAAKLGVGRSTIFKKMRELKLTRAKIEESLARRDLTN